MNSSSITHLTSPTLQSHDDWIHAMPTSEAEHHPYIAGRIAVIHSEIQRLAQSINIRDLTSLLNISADTIAAHQENLSSSLSNFTSYNASNSTAVINDLRQAYRTIVAVTAHHHAAMAAPDAAEIQSAEEKTRNSDSSKDSLEGAFSGVSDLRDAGDLPPLMMTETPDLNQQRPPRDQDPVRQITESILREASRIAFSTPTFIGEPYLGQEAASTPNAVTPTNVVTPTNAHISRRSSPSDHDTVLMASAGGTPPTNNTTPTSDSGNEDNVN